jgi:hypothetical protein
MAVAGKTQSGARQNRRLGGPSNSRGYAAFRFGEELRKQLEK